METARPAKDHLAELLEKHPELRPHMLPASAGDIAALGKKLDEIAGLLRRLTNELAHKADAAHMPEPGHVVMDHISGAATSIRASLLPGMSLTLPPVPTDNPATAEQADQIIKLMTSIDSRLAGDGEELKALRDLMQRLLSRSA